MRNIPVFNCCVSRNIESRYERARARARHLSIKYSSARQELYPRAAANSETLRALVRNENSRIETRIAHGAQPFP